MIKKTPFKYKIYTLIPILFFVFKNSYHAFGGYTHYYICSKVIYIDENLKNLSEEEKLAYKSGSVIADVGRFYFDDFFPASDEEIFKNELIKMAMQDNDKKLKLFALGWSDHVIQDKHTSKIFNKIFENTQNYRIRCGKCDTYFYEKTGYLSDKTLFCPNTLIKHTYKQFKINNISLNVKNKKIKKEISKILKALYAQSWLGITGLSEKESKTAKYELKNLALLCGSNNPDYKILFPDN